jgi:hypothetical protein
MKKVFFFLTLAAFGMNANAQPPKIEAKKGMAFGKTFTPAEAVHVNKLNEMLIANEPRAVLVEGKVTEVCKAEGCWLKLDSKQGPILVKMKNHAFLVPLSLNGQVISISGTAVLQETSVEMQKHYAEDAGKSSEEIAMITEPKKEIIIQAEGIVVQ